MTEVAQAQPNPAKVDPESLALRTRPPRAIRFRRGVIISIAALAWVSIVATAWIALEPKALHMLGQADEQTEAARPPTDTLGALPASYGNVPKLGPPLPDDLGKPILDSQRQQAVVSGAGDLQRAAQERWAAELKTARESGLLVQTGKPAAGADAIAASMVPVPAVTEPPKLALDPDHDPNAQQRKADFAGANDKDGDRNPHALIAAASPYMLCAGSVIAASLITGLRSDLPGLVIAQVTERVFDSATGKILLIPQGARLIGSYDSVVAFGQKRALVVWQRIIMPDGSSLRIDNVPATDPSGYAGLADKIDVHSWALLKGVVLSTLLGVGTQLSLSGQSDLVQAIRESTQQNVSRAGDQITSKSLAIQPTITIRPGAAVRLVVHRDLILAPWTE